MMGGSSRGRRDGGVWGATRRSGRASLSAAGVLLLAASVIACNLGTDFAEDLVDKTAERNERRLVEQQRQELPLPDPEVVRYISLTAEDLVLDEDFRVDLVDDLVIGEKRTGSEYLFSRFTGRGAALGNVAVDHAGRLFVLEARSREVRAFDPSGEFLFKFGRPGQGPADFEGPFGMIVAGARIHVFHRRFSSSIWDLDGNFERDHATLRTPEAQEAARLDETTSSSTFPTREDARRRSEGARLRMPLQVTGRPDGSMIMMFRAVPDEPTGRIVTPYVRVVGRFEDGAEVQRYIEVPEWAGLSIAVSPDGGMYVGMFGHLRTEHYIIALDAAARPRWVLVTPWDTKIFPSAYLRVDGQGRLFVFPNFQVIDDDPRSQLHVYTGDGELIGSGYLNRRPVYLHWQVATADHVYGVHVNASTEEWEVVRYQLKIPTRERNGPR